MKNDHRPLGGHHHVLAACTVLWLSSSFGVADLEVVANMNLHRSTQNGEEPVCFTQPQYAVFCAGELIDDPDGDNMVSKTEFSEVYSRGENTSFLSLSIMAQLKFVSLVCDQVEDQQNFEDETCLESVRNSDGFGLSLDEWNPGKTIVKLQTLCSSLFSDAVRSGYIRQCTDAPTGAPTRSPTEYPTEAPTSKPTLQPTRSPTPAPTLSPTPAPTNNPTKTPTTSPTPQPSSHPSVTPSKVPTAVPSSSPSTLPSRSPSNAPSQTPSGSPSDLPSTTPSAAPSVAPSVSPTLFPSSQPSHHPSASPSYRPSGTPTISMRPTEYYHPSASPSQSALPSSSPSDVPSLEPTHVPSARPTGQPSESPSSVPSSIPTQVPTGSPSSIPTANPSSYPSHSPSHYPSARPSSAPSLSFNPTDIPSSIPSTSLLPTSSPSDMPSMAPTVAPSLKPSSHPSNSPSMIPSASPTLAPSLNPSQYPTPIPERCIKESEFRTACMKQLSKDPNGDGIATKQDFATFVTRTLPCLVRTSEELDMDSCDKAVPVDEVNSASGEFSSLPFGMQLNFVLSACDQLDDAGITASECTRRSRSSSGLAEDAPSGFFLDQGGERAVKEFCTATYVDAVDEGLVEPCPETRCLTEQSFQDICLFHLYQDPDGDQFVSKNEFTGFVTETLPCITLSTGEAEEEHDCSQQNNERGDAMSSFDDLPLAVQDRFVGTSCLVLGEMGINPEDCQLMSTFNPTFGLLLLDDDSFIPNNGQVDAFCNSLFVDVADGGYVEECEVVPTSSPTVAISTRQIQPISSSPSSSPSSSSIPPRLTGPRDGEDSDVTSSPSIRNAISDFFFSNLTYLAIGAGVGIILLAVLILLCRRCCTARKRKENECPPAPEEVDTDGSSKNPSEDDGQSGSLNEENHVSNEELSSKDGGDDESSRDLGDITNEGDTNDAGGKTEVSLGTEDHGALGNDQTNPDEERRKNMMAAFFQASADGSIVVTTEALAEFMAFNDSFQDGNTM